jgi:hypothetical protein
MLIEGDSSLAVTMVTGLLLIGALVLKVMFERNFRASWAARMRQLRSPLSHLGRPG